MLRPYARNAILAIAGTLAFNLLLFMLLPILVHGPEPEAQMKATAAVHVRSPAPSHQTPEQSMKQPRPVAKTSAPMPQAVVSTALLPQLSSRMLTGMALPQPLTHVDLPAFDFSPVALDAVSQVEVGAVPEFYAAADLDQPVRPVAQTPFMYPLRAKRKGIEGWVRVAMYVDVQGRVEGVDIIKAEPEGVFDESVRRGLRSWRFSAATRAGERVKTRVVTTIRFELEN